MTGQAQGANYANANAFKTAVICKAGSIVNVLFNNCAGGISVDVKSYPSFSNVTISSKIVAGNFDTSTLTFSPGGSCDIVVARLFYKWPLFVMGLGYNISNLNGNQRLLVATPGAYLIYSEISYTYVPMIGYVMKGGVTLNDTAYTRPRQSTCVFYPSVPAPVPPATQAACPTA
jgi:hypothetical protein